VQCHCELALALFRFFAAVFFIFFHFFHFFFFFHFMCCKKTWLLLFVAFLKAARSSQEDQKPVFG
jgi:hypothetical protein